MDTFCTSPLFPLCATEIIQKWVLQAAQQLGGGFCGVFFFPFIYLFILAAIVKEVSQGRRQSSGMDKVKGWKFYCQISLEGFGCRKIR